MKQIKQKNIMKNNKQKGHSNQVMVMKPMAMMKKMPMKPMMKSSSRKGAMMKKVSRSSKNY